MFTLSGRMETEHIAELERTFGHRMEYGNSTVDLKEVRLVDRASVKFLRGCEADGMKLENCPAYVREWMDREEG